MSAERVIKKYKARLVECKNCFPPSLGSTQYEHYEGWLYAFSPHNSRTSKNNYFFVLFTI
jgi:hypothetical protein